MTLCVDEVRLARELNARSRDAPASSIQQFSSPNASGGFDGFSFEHRFNNFSTESHTRRFLLWDRDNRGGLIRVRTLDQIRAHGGSDVIIGLPGLYIAIAVSRAGF
jgi:hypothetical protein